MKLTKKAIKRVNKRLNEDQGVINKTLSAFCDFVKDDPEHTDFDLRMIALIESADDDNKRFIYTFFSNWIDGWEFRFNTGFFSEKYYQKFDTKDRS